VAKLARPSALVAPASDWWQRTVFVLTLLLALAVPLVWDTALLEPFRGIKRELATAVWALLASLALLRNLNGRVWRDPYLLPWAGALAGALLSAPLSGAPLKVLSSSIPLALASLGWVAVRQLSDRQRRELTRLVVWAGAIEAALTILFAAPDWRPESFARLTGLEHRYAWIGTLGNPADVSIFIALPFLLALREVLATRRRRLGNLVACSLMLVALAGTQTLSVLAAVGVGAAALLLPLVERRHRLPAVAAALAAVVVLVALTPARSRVVGALEFVHRGEWEWLGSGRGAGYSAALGMLASHPLTGVGFGQFEAGSFAYQSEDVLASRARSLGMEIGFGEAHNELLQHAAETGLLGLALLGAGVVLAWKRRRRDSDTLPARLPLLLTASLVALAQFPLHQATTAAQWAILAALAAPALPVTPLPRGRRALVAGLSVLALASGATAVVTVRRLATSAALQQAQVLVDVLRRGAVSTRATPARIALANLTPAVAWLPYDWQAENILGNLAMEAGDNTAALDHFEKALRLAERPELHFNVAMAAMLAGDESTGMAHLLRAVKLNPSVIKQVSNPELLDKLHTALEADGYLKRHPWVLE
jgi:O-antigen ligase